MLLVLVLPLHILAMDDNNSTDIGIIKGKITTSDHKPAIAVTVLVKGSSKNAVTDDEGNFSIKLPAGVYELEVSLIGYVKQTKSVTVEKQATVGIQFQIEVSDVQLQEIIVTSGRNKFAARETEQVARIPLKKLENPQVYQVIGRALMNDQVVTDRTDIYRNVAGAVPNFAVGGSQGMSIRGFANTTGMRNGMITSAIVPLNPAILDRVEVIKGPSGTLFGSNRNMTLGGVYNYITKQPYDHFGGEFNYTGGSFEFSRVFADLNTPLDKEKKQLLRLVVAGQTESSFQDQGFAKNYTIAPVFSYRVNDRLKFTIDADITRSSFAMPTLAIASLNNVSARSFKELQLGYNRSYITNNVNVDNGINNIQARVEYKLSRNWASQTNYLYSEGFYKHFYWTILNLLTDSTLYRSVRNQTPEKFGNIQLQQNFIGDFNIGSFRNRVVVGLDYNYGYNSLYRVTVNYDTLNINKPLNDYNTDKINLLSWQKGFYASTTKSSSYAVYVSDVFNIAPNLLAMLSLRADKFTTDGNYNVATGKFSGGYQQTSFSPKFGLVYQPIQNKLALFANYLNGFVNTAPLLQPDNTILKLNPQYGNQWEVGVKADLIQRKLNATFSYYNIDVTNSTRTEVINGRTYAIQDGTQRSRGYELELAATPVAGFNIIAGYAYNENKYTKASPAIQGKMITASPQQVGNIWASYSITQGKMKGMGIGAGGNYVSSSWFDVTNSFAIPSYTLLDATVFYDQPAYRLALKGNNLLNKEYWNTNGTPQKPIHFLVSVTIRL
jgi:iron complex outermembrane receptor protein